MTQIFDKRKFHNPTPGWVGVVILDEDNKRQGVSVEPGAYVWLSDVEQRLTAEAPRSPEDNPFVRAWERPTGEVNQATGEEVTVTEHGMLRVTDDPPRPIASDRFIPGQESGEPESRPEPTDQDGEPESVEEPPHTGAAPTPVSPPEQGQRDEQEVVATPEAVPANDAAQAARESAPPEATPAPTPPPRAPIPSA